MEYWNDGMMEQWAVPGNSAFPVFQLSQLDMFYESGIT